MIKNNRIGIVIVTFNSEKTISECLNSIFKNTDGVEVVVVDNNSQDETARVVGEFGNKVTFLESKENIGFAKANNLGIKRVTSDYVVFLNPDTRILEKDSLETLRNNLAENPEYGLIGPKLVFPNGQIQKSVRNLPSFWRALKEYVLGVKGAYDFYLPKAFGLVEVESVVGACVVIKKDLFDRLGGFDERYFLYFEDLQLCKDIKKAGLKVGFLSTVTVQHREGASGPGQKTLKYLYESAKTYHSFLGFYLISAIIKIGVKLHG